jgi:hypothetical protein
VSQNKHYYTFTIRDYSEELSTSRIYFGAVTALNIAGFLAQLGDFRNALTALITGVLARDAWIGDSTIRSNATPTSPASQNELKIQFLYEGVNTRKRYRFEVPTADTSKVLPNSDQINLADSEVAAFITAFETLGRTPDDDTEEVNVIGARLVGRNI